MLYPLLWPLLKMTDEFLNHNLLTGKCGQIETARALESGPESHAASLTSDMSLVESFNPSGFHFRCLQNGDNKIYLT